MSVIIRLQGLPWSASAMNIRHFFTGLSIPAGGVHIIGGDGGDAFIAFSSDDDARMAMKMNMCPLNGTPVQLFLSSKSEMQSVIDAARSGNPAASSSTPSSMPPTAPSAAGGMGGANIAAGGGGSVGMGGAVGNQQLPHVPPGYTGMHSSNNSGANTNSNQFSGHGHGVGGSGGFQGMQQGGDGMNSGGMGMGHGGGNSEWQPMMGAAASGGGADGPFNSNQQRMMVDDDRVNRFPGYQDGRQHQSLHGNNYMGGHGQMPPGQMGMQGMGERPRPGMEPHGGHGEPMAPDARRFGDDMRSGGMGPGMKPPFGQFGGAEERDKMMSGFMPGSRNMDMEKDPMNKPMGGGGGMMDLPRNRGPNELMGRTGFQGAAEGPGKELMKDRLGGQMLGGPAGSGSPGPLPGGPWESDNKKKEGPFSHKAPPGNPDAKREAGDMIPEPHPRRDRANRVNRFAEVPERPDKEPFPHQPPAMNEPNFERDMRMHGRFHDGPRDQMDNMPPGRGPPERLPSDRRGGPMGDDGVGMPSTRYPPDEDLLQEEGRYPMGRGGPDDRRPQDDRRPPNRFMQDDMRPMNDEHRMPGNDRGRFGSDERGFGPNDGGRFPPHGERFHDNDRRFPPDQRFMGNDRNFPMSNDRAYPGDDRRPPPGDGRMKPEDRQGMWQGDRPKPDEMMGRRPGNNPFPPDDPRYREREQELRREAFERNHPSQGGDWPPNEPMRGGRMDFQGRPGNEDSGGRPFPPDRRGFPGERRGGPGFRDDERDFYGPPGRMDGRPDGGPSRWGRGEDGDMDRPDMGGRGPFPGNVDSPVGRPDRGPMPNPPNSMDDGPSDMDQRISHGMYGNRRPGMGPGFGHDEPQMDGEFGGGPHDFDNRSMGHRGRGGGMMMGDRPPRGRGDPFGRGRPGPMSMGRGRGMDVDRRFDEGGHLGQDVDNRNIGGDRFSNMHNQGPPSDMPPKPPMGKSLLGDGPRDPAAGREPADRGKPDEHRSDVSRRDNDNRYTRRDSRDRDRRYDDRRGRDRDERDRYRSRYDRDRERDRDRGDRDRDRDRDRRRSRSRSRNRSWDRDRYSRDRSSRDKSSKPDNMGPRKPDQRPTPFLHVTNMPLSISYRDLRRFFYPLEIPFDGIKIINDKDGNRIGDAFLYFQRLNDAISAQRKSGERNEGKVVNISFVSEQDFVRAVDSFVPLLDKKEPIVSTPASKPAPNINAEEKLRYIVQLSNLPLSITRQDINQFFKNLKIDKEGEAAYIEFDAAGVATGKGYVEFITDVDYKKALTHNGSLMGTSTIGVLPGKAEDADKLKAVQGQMFQRAALRNLNKTGRNAPNQPQVEPQKPGSSEGAPKLPTGQRAAADPPTTTSSSVPMPKPTGNAAVKEDASAHDTVCVHVQGLPLLATPRDIKEFFSDCQIALRGINIAHDSQGKPLGEGFVEFKFPADFEKALKRDKTSMGRHIVAVKSISKKDMLERFENAKQQGAPPRPLISPPSSSMSSQQNKPPTSQAQQTPQNNNAAKPAATPTPPQGQLESRQPNPQQNLLLPRAPAPIISPDSKGPPSASPNAPNPRGPGPELVKNQGPLLPLLQTPQSQVLMPGGGKSFPPGVLNDHWFYVRCQNFPPDITINEIMQFFKGFRPIGESIRLHYSSEGHPTGNAVVGFGSADEATRALQCLNLRACRHNIVTLHPA